MKFIYTRNMVLVVFVAMPKGFFIRRPRTCSFRHLGCNLPPLLFNVELREYGATHSGRIIASKTPGCRYFTQFQEV